MAAPLRVLMLEDRPSDSDMVLYELRRAGFDPDWRRVDTRSDYLASLDTDWDIILADYSLPQFDAPQALRIVQERELSIPFIMISGTVGEELAVECIKQGAADYLLKDRLARLGPAVSKALADRRLALEKQQAETALRESEERHRLLFDSASQGIGYFTPQGRIIAFNQVAAAFMGGSPEDFTGKTLFDLYREDGAEYQARIEAAVDQGDNQIYEDLVHLPTGNEKWFLSTYARIVDASGEVVGIQIISNDITERKQSEAAMRASEIAEREQRILAETLKETAAALISAVDFDTVMQVILDNVALVVPHDAANIMLIEGDEAHVVYRQGYSPEILPLVAEMKIPLATTGHLQQMLTTRYPFLIPHTDHEPAWARLPHTAWVKSYVAAPIRSHEDVIGFINVDSGVPGFFTQDHAQRLQAFADQASIAIERTQLFEEIRRHAADLETRVEERTAQLNHAKERTEAVLNSSYDVIILCRGDGTIDQANPAFEHVFGRGAEEVLFQPLTRLVIPQHAPLVEEAFRTVLETGQPQRQEVAAQLTQGLPLEMELTLSLVIEHNDAALGVVCIMHDVSERKRMETELRAALAREMELNELKTRFVGMISHDVRTPLAVISSSTEILRVYYERLNEAMRAKHFDQISAQVGRMVALLNDVLTISRADSGTTLFSPAPLDLDEYCRALVEEYRYSPTMEHILVYSSPGEPLVLPADEKVLYQALTNLLNNAVRYSPEGSTIHLELSSDAQHAILRVADSGIGIPEEDLPYLFETFHRGSNVGEIQGTGLGMAIVKRSIDAHGGTVTCESQVDVGTTFTIKLPRTGPEEAEDDENPGH